MQRRNRYALGKAGLGVPLLLLGLAAALPARSRGVPSPAGEERAASAEEPAGDPGERVPPSMCGPSWVESMEAVIARDALLPPELRLDPRARRGLHGVWQIPSREANLPGRAHSGRHYAVNQWGDTLMGIGFPEPTDVEGAWIAGQADAGVWPGGLRAVGYRDGAEVGRTEWLGGLAREPRWWPIGLSRLDRVVFEARPAVNGAAWYALDDLTLSREEWNAVIDFEDLDYRTRLTGSGYAGLSWEEGRGDFERGGGVPAPVDPKEEIRGETLAGGGGPAPEAGGGTAPSLISDFKGIQRGDAGQSSYPPDSCGAVGPAHFVEAVNLTVGIFDKDTGVKVFQATLASFLGTGTFVGDPRVLYDQHSGRYFVAATDFSSRLYIAVSTSGDPLGSWFKTSFVMSQGSDAGAWPDYPTLGVDQDGLYTSAYMVNRGTMSMWALEKAPLIAASPSLGVITAWRGYAYQGAIQPAHTYGAAPGFHFISLYGATRLRVRRVTGPLTGPSLSTVGDATIGAVGDPPNAPAKGSTTGLNTVGNRLMNAVWRDGYIYTAHTIGFAGKAACRWYKVDVAGMQLADFGTVFDPSLYYFFPGISVNQRGDLVMGFSGSDANTYGSAYATGRLAGDPAGEMGPPLLLRAGTAPHNLLDGYGRNRWGDYSLTSLDPEDELTLWTIQEYVQANDVWGTWIGELLPDGIPPPSVYCTAKVNSQTCTPQMAFSGVPSASDPNPFDLSATGIVNGKNGLLFYGLGANNLPFQGGTLCVQAPIKRTGVQGSGGFVPCDGTYSFDFNALIQGGSDPSLVVDAEVFTQYWYRDPADPAGYGTGLTDACRFGIEP